MKRTIIYVIRQIAYKIVALSLLNVRRGLLHTFGEYDSVEGTVEFNVHPHVRFLTLHLQVLDFDRVRHGLQRPRLVVRAPL